MRLASSNGLFQSMKYPWSNQHGLSPKTEMFGSDCLPVDYLPPDYLLPHYLAAERGSYPPVSVGMWEGSLVIKVFFGPDLELQGAGDVRVTVADFEMVLRGLLRSKHQKEEDFPFFKVVHLPHKIALENLRATYADSVISIKAKPVN